MSFAQTDLKKYEMQKRAAKYTWTAVNIPVWTAQVKYMCGKHWGNLPRECWFLAQSWLLLLPVETGVLKMVAQIGEERRMPAETVLVQALQQQCTSGESD